MPTKPKIKIEDHSELRIEIDNLYEQTEQVELAKWAIECARNILPLSKTEKVEMSEIENEIKINELWQIGKASVHEIRQAGFRVHAIARKCKTEVGKNVIRTVGQAIGVGHMKEHVWFVLIMQSKQYNSLSQTTKTELQKKENGNYVH